MSSRASTVASAGGAIPISAGPSSGRWSRARASPPSSSGRNERSEIGGRSMATPDWLELGAQNLADVWEHCAVASGGRSDRWPGARVADSGSACPFLNSAVLTRPPEAEDMAGVTDKLEQFYAAGT